ncbi:MAG: PIN domain-containing protein [Planctomycetota bacterium]|nr:PIN domain-containing protein [Planctomycetota bacterium]
MLIDTSVWIDHFARGVTGMDQAIASETIVMHEDVLGELALGNFAHRARVLSLLRALPLIPRVSHEEILELVERHELWGKGLGVVDAHILGACLVAHETLWTRDRTLSAAASAVGVRLHAGGAS